MRARLLLPFQMLSVVLYPLRVKQLGIITFIINPFRLQLPVPVPFLFLLNMVRLGLSYTVRPLPLTLVRYLPSVLSVRMCVHVNSRANRVVLWAIRVSFYDVFCFFVISDVF